MLRLLKWLLVIAVLLGIVAGLLLSGVYVAAKQVPEFYEQALACDHETALAANDELLQRAAALASEVKKPGTWKASFTEDQINGWLAVDLPNNHPTALPTGVSEPRVRLDEDRVLVGFRLENDSFTGVVSAEADVYWTEDQRLAVSLRRLQAGALPLPLGMIMDRIREAVEDVQWQIRWIDEGSGPVALIEIPPHAEGEFVRNVEMLRIEPQRLLLAGSTEPRPAQDPKQDQDQEPEVEAEAVELPAAVGPATADARSNTPAGS